MFMISNQLWRVENLMPRVMTICHVSCVGCSGKRIKTSGQFMHMTWTRTEYNMATNTEPDGFCYTRAKLSRLALFYTFQCKFLDFW